MSKADKSDINRRNKQIEASAEMQSRYTYRHTDRRKAKLLKYLQVNMGIVKYACMDAGVSRDTFYRWLKEDPEFRLSVEMIDGDTGDYVEKKLISLIRDGSEKAILFYAETKLKDRGYFRKTQNDTTIRPDEGFKITLDL